MSSEPKKTTVGANGGSKKDEGKKPSHWKDIVKDENVAKAVGAIIFGGIAYNIYRSSTKSKPITETVASSSSGQYIKGSVETVGKELPVDTSTGLRQHQVATGDTLFSLSKTYKVPIDELRGSNVIEDDKIWVGQVLNIPS